MSSWFNPLLRVYDRLSRRAGPVNSSVAGAVLLQAGLIYTLFGKHQQVSGSARTEVKYPECWAGPVPCLAVAGTPGPITLTRRRPSGFEPVSPSRLLARSVYKLRHACLAGSI
jgi:hypothetical protein